MSRAIRFHPEARAELREAVRFYEERASGLGADLAAEIAAVIESIRSNPDIGAPAENDTRRKFLP